jgi:Protein kinase domain
VPEKAGIQTPRAVAFEDIAGYRLIRLLGQGGFANTYLAERDGRSFALKVLHELPSGAMAGRFKREIAALQLEHPNLVSYEDSGVAAYGGLTVAFIAMPYLPGRTLREAMDASSKPLSIDLVRSIGAAVAQGLSFLHEQNAAHRDLTPKNIYLTDSGEVLIIDFGLAKLLDRTSLTLKGQLVGTPAYCAPEQLRNESDLHTDLYGLGVTLYHALTGRLPFEANNLMALLEMIRDEEPEAPSLVNPKISDDLDELVLALMAKEPVQRPNSAAAVAAALEKPASSDQVKPAPYDRDAPPRLAIRTSSPAAARAVLGAAMTGAVPDIAVASVTTPGPLAELVRAASFDDRLRVAVDTRVEATAAIAMPKALQGRAYAPMDGKSYSHESLRSPSLCKKVARGDIDEQAREGAALLRGACFPFGDADDPWIKRDRRILSDQLRARDAIDAEAPFYAAIRCDVDALALRQQRISIANRFSRGTPDGYWIDIYGLSAGSKPEVIAATFDLLMLLQERGVPSLASLPAPLVRLAWSVGIGGAEVKLGRVGGANAPTIRTPTRTDQGARFEFPSVFTSLPPTEATALLESGVLPESECHCPSCRLAQDPAACVQHAEEHDLACWLALRDEMAAFAVADRVDRLRTDLNTARDHLAEARSAAGLKQLTNRTVNNLETSLGLLIESGLLQSIGQLRR